MKTIEVNVYQFSELTEQAKVRALSNYQSDCEYDWSYDAIQSLKAFMNAVGVELTDYQIDWLNPRISKVRYDGTPHGKFIKEDLTGVFSDYPLTKNWNYSKNIEYAVDCFLAEICNDYEYQLSEENYAEICESNDYWFDENGNLI
jgi:hypothetical protein